MTTEETFNIGPSNWCEQVKAITDPEAKAEAVKKLLDKAFEWALKHNAPVQDYLAEETDRARSQTDDDGEYATKCIKILSEMETHLKTGREKGLNNDEQYIVDSLWSWVPHDYPQPYVDCAKAIYAQVPTLYGESSDERSFVNALMHHTDQTAGQFEVDFDITDTFSLPCSYIMYWAKDYYRRMKGGDQ